MMPPTPNVLGVKPNSAGLAGLGRRHEGRVVLGLDVEDADHDHQQHDHQLDRDDDRGDA
jgi:hypothetical protein